MQSCEEDVLVLCQLRVQQQQQEQRLPRRCRRWSAEQVPSLGPRARASLAQDQSRVVAQRASRT